MINYIDIKAVIPRLPKYIRDNYNETELLSHALQAYRELTLPQSLQNKVCILEIKNYQAELPKEIKEINLITHTSHFKPFTEDFINNEEVSTELEIERCVSNTNTVYYKLASNYLNSNYHTDHFTPLMYSTTNLNNNCKMCNNYIKCNSNNYFSVDDNRIITISDIEDTLLCIWYNTESDKIIDHPHILTYLSYAVQHKINIERTYLSEENAGNMLSYTASLSQIWYNKASSAVLLRNLNFNLLDNILYNDSDMLYFRDYLTNNIYS